jgi:DNA-binding XRE family transcriptional regulator
MSDQSRTSFDPQAAAEEIEALEYQNDVMAFRLARYETANDERIPFDLVSRVSAGENPPRVWREHRGLSLSEAAAAARLSEPVLVEIEAGLHNSSLSDMHRLARALRVDLDDLVPWTRESDESA